MTRGALRKAFVLGAGLGKRLRPLTSRRPKPLIPVFQKPLITFAFDHLIAAGIEEFVVNTHHCAEAYDHFFPNCGGIFSYQDAVVTFRHEPVLLETGGGIKNVEDLIGNEPFLVYNGDVLADIPLEGLIARHLEEKNVATLLLRSGGGPLQVQWNVMSGRIVDIGRRLGVPHDGPDFLFSGIYVLDPRIFSELKAGEIVSITPVLTDLIRRGEKIGGVVCDEGMWFDLGTRDAYLDAHRELARREFRFSYPIPAPWPLTIEDAAAISEDAELDGLVVVGKGTHVGPGAWLRNTIVWENANIASDSALDGCIITDGQNVQGSHTGKDFG